MSTGMIIGIVFIVIAVISFPYVFNHGGRMQKIIEEMFKKDEYARQVCKTVLKVGDEIRYNERRCKILKINYLSETIDVKDLETGETMNTSFFSSRLELPQL